MSHVVCETLHQNDLIHQGQGCMSGSAAVTAVTVCVAGNLMVSRKQLDNDNN